MARYQFTPEDRRKGGLARGEQQRAQLLAAKQARFITEFDPRDFSNTPGEGKGHYKGATVKKWVAVEYAMLTQADPSKPDFRVKRGVVRVYTASGADVLKVIIASQKIDSGQIKMVAFKDPFTGQGVYSGIDREHTIARAFLDSTEDLTGA